MRQSASQHLEPQTSTLLYTCPRLTARPRRPSIRIPRTLLLARYYLPRLKTALRRNCGDQIAVKQNTAISSSASETQFTRLPEMEVRPGSKSDSLTSHARNNHESREQLPQKYWFGRRMISSWGQGLRTNADPAQLACTIYLALNCPVIDTAINMWHTNSAYSSNKPSWPFVLHDFEIRFTCQQKGVFEAGTAPPSYENF